MPPCLSGSGRQNSGFYNAAVMHAVSVLVFYCPAIYAPTVLVGPQQIVRCTKGPRGSVDPQWLLLCLQVAPPPLLGLP